MIEFIYTNKKHTMINQTLFKALMSYYLRIVQHIENNVRLSVQVVYRSCRSELSSDIELSQANFYSAELSAG